MSTKSLVCPGCGRVFTHPPALAIHRKSCLGAGAAGVADAVGHTGGGDPTACVDRLLGQLLAVRGVRRIPEVEMAEKDILALIAACRVSFLALPSLLEIAPPIQICGDIHGQYNDLLQLLECGGMPPQSRYLFLGDYVDRGKWNLETICLLLCFSQKYPDHCHLLRGNHECASINRLYGFYDECKRRYSIKLWKRFIQLFDCLPVAAIVGSRILCMHGGLSPSMQSPDDIREIQRPCDVPDAGLLCDLLWADPAQSPAGGGDSDEDDDYGDEDSTHLGTILLRHERPSLLINNCTG